jgi:hypothetical protein
MITKDFIDGFTQIEEILKTSETEEQFGKTKQWALTYIDNERRFQRKKYFFFLRKYVDEVYDVFYEIILHKKFLER